MNHAINDGAKRQFLHLTVSNYLQTIWSNDREGRKVCRHGNNFLRIVCIYLSWRLMTIALWSTVVHETPLVCLYVAYWTGLQIHRCLQLAGLHDAAAKYMLTRLSHGSNSAKTQWASWKECRFRLQVLRLDWLTVFRRGGEICDTRWTGVWALQQSVQCQVESVYSEPKLSPESFNPGTLMLYPHFIKKKKNNFFLTTNNVFKWENFTESTHSPQFFRMRISD